jgi:hypothetical protein
MVEVPPSPADLLQDDKTKPPKAIFKIRIIRINNSIYVIIYLKGIQIINLMKKFNSYAKKSRAVQSGNSFKILKLIFFTQLKEEND